MENENTTMRIITSINEYVKYALLPKYMRNRNLIYHATMYEYFLEILKSGELYGTDGYDFGVATSRNKHYAFGRDEDGEQGHNLSEIQIILDKDHIKSKYKVTAFDYENYKKHRGKTGEYSDGHQSEDKILTDMIEDVDKYIYGIHIVKDKLIGELQNNQTFINKAEKFGWVIFSENWNDITHEFI